MCLTLDLVSNALIRRFVGIFKRNLRGVVVDFACIVESEDKRSCIFGLWKMNHLIEDDNPDLPD
jgi:hypothetical protein